MLGSAGRAQAPVTRWPGGVPVLLSSGDRGSFGSVGVVGGVGGEHGQDEVAAAAGDADDGGVVAFAFGSFAFVVGAGVGVVAGGEEGGE